MTRLENIPEVLFKMAYHYGEITYEMLTIEKEINATVKRLIDLEKKKVALEDERQALTLSMCVDVRSD